jgi:hypothetical protein
MTIFQWVHYAMIRFNEHTDLGWRTYGAHRDKKKAMQVVYNAVFDSPEDNPNDSNHQYSHSVSGRR